MRGSVRATALTGGVLSAQCQSRISGALSGPCVRSTVLPPPCPSTATGSSAASSWPARWPSSPSRSSCTSSAGSPITSAIPLGLDWLGYRAGFDRLLATGTPYAAFELAGPFTPEHLDFIHPPNALVLFAPFAILPQPLDYILWIAIPIAIFCFLLRGLPWWAWPFVALLSTTNSLQYPILNGNSSLFMTAIFGLGFRYGWVVGLLAMKPTLAPLAIVGFRRSPRTLFVAGALAVVPILVTLPLFADYLTVARNMQGIPLTYSVSNYSLIALAALPWVAGKLPGWWARCAARATGRLSSPPRTRLTGRSDGRAARDRGEGRGAQDRDEHEGDRQPDRRRAPRSPARPGRPPPEEPGHGRASVPVADRDPGPRREREQRHRVVEPGDRREDERQDRRHRQRDGHRPDPPRDRGGRHDRQERHERRDPRRDRRVAERAGPAGWPGPTLSFDDEVGPGARLAGRRCSRATVRGRRRRR